MKSMPKYTKTALILTLLLTLLLLGSLLWIHAVGINPPARHMVARIYQDGELIDSIPLHTVEEAYTFTVVGENNCRNEIEVRPGSIGIISADCPDKLCIHQGFVDSSLLPITCLPNRLVIQLREEETISREAAEVDVITY